MQNVEENLQKLSQTVLEQATNKRKLLDDELEKKKQESIKQKEIEFLGKAYKKIQSSIAKTNSDTNEKVAKTQIECKGQLISRREEIISEVFNNVSKKISEFVSADQYYNWLLDIVKETVSEAGEGNIVVLINKSDEKWIPQLQKDIIVSGINIVQDEDIIGGAKALNIDKGIIVDNSIKFFLDQQRNGFLRVSGLSII